jgi:sphingomyelin phosphodiesterase 2
MTALMTLIAVFLGAILLVLLFFVNNRMPSETDLAKSLLLKAPPGPLVKPIDLKLITFNIHDLYVASKNRPERMIGIAKKLREMDPDFVGIQEAFIKKDREVLLKELEGSRLKYSHYYPSATVGSGLMALSAYPIRETFYYRYTRNGFWYRFTHGDWWAGKGVALTRIEVGGGYMDIYDTHAHAHYGVAEYTEICEAQMEELAKFVKMSMLASSPAFVLGDFNCTPDSAAYKNAVDGAGLERLMTMDTHIDHIFGVVNTLYKYEALKTDEITGTYTINGVETELSDHSGYMSTIRITPTLPGAGK